MKGKRKHKKDWGINTMSDLRREKKRLREDLMLTRRSTGAILDSLPGAALQGGIDVILGAIVRGVQNNNEQAATAAQAQPESFDETVSEENKPVSDTLKEVGKETAVFAVTQLLERLLRLK